MKHIYLTEEGNKFFNEIFSIQKKRIYKALLNSTSEEVVTTEEVEDTSSEPIEEENGPWILGRGAKIIVQGVEIGQFGEIDPIVSEKYGLKTPIHGGEFDIKEINKVASDPLI